MKFKNVSIGIVTVFDAGIRKEVAPGEVFEFNRDVTGQGIVKFKEPRKETMIKKTKESDKE